MDEGFRVSDAYRDDVASHLREHFAQGRHTADELDERLTATLTAKTFGDLGTVTADLPGLATVAGEGSESELRPLAAPAGTTPGRGAPGWRGARRGPRILPIALIALIVTVAIPGSSWLFAAFIKAIIVFWLIACLAGIFVAARFRRPGRPGWWSGRHPDPGHD